MYCIYTVKHIIHIIILIKPDTTATVDADLSNVYAPTDTTGPRHRRIAFIDFSSCI